MPRSIDIMCLYKLQFESYQSNILGSLMFQLFLLVSCLFLECGTHAVDIPSFMRIGHRGASGYEPENTLRSFKKALALGVDMIEFDVHVCASGELVVIHDTKVDRTTNGTGYVANKTLQELKKLDAGKGEQIPTLLEVLDVINQQAIVNIELKGVNTAEPVAKIINEYVTQKGWKYDKFFVSSFNHIELLKFKKLVPQVKTGALLEGIPVRLASFAQDCKAQAIGVFKDYVTQEYVNDAHKKKLKVYVFTVNEPDEIERIKKLGVDGIFSNFPDRL